MGRGELARPGQCRRCVPLGPARHRIPAIYAFRSFPGGGLMSCGMDMISVYRDAAAHVDRILRGETPGDLPVQAPTGSSW